MSDAAKTAIGILLPFLGTVLGAGMVFAVGKTISGRLQKALLGFASGVMIAASVWSLLIPAIEMAEEAGGLAWVPAVAGFLLGMAFLLLLDTVVPHLHLNDEKPEGRPSGLGRSFMLVLAVTLHNIPEGMAVGVVFAGMLEGSTVITGAGALALAIGIAVQNFPEGAIISAPLVSAGLSRKKAFGYGVLSGIVEPLGAVFDHADSAVYFSFCGRRYDLCGGGRADSGGTGGGTQQYRHGRRCTGFCADDAFGCGIGIKEYGKWKWVIICRSFPIGRS